MSLIQRTKHPDAGLTTNGNFSEFDDATGFLGAALTSWPKNYMFGLAPTRGSERVNPFETDVWIVGCSPIGFAGKLEMVAVHIEA